MFRFLRLAFPLLINVLVSNANFTTTTASVSDSNSNNSHEGKSQDGRHPCSRQAHPIFDKEPQGRRKQVDHHEEKFYCWLCDGLQKNKPCDSFKEKEACQDSKLAACFTFTGNINNVSGYIEKGCLGYFERQVFTQRCREQDGSDSDWPCDNHNVQFRKENYTGQFCFCDESYCNGVGGLGFSSYFSFHLELPVQNFLLILIMNNFL